MNAPVLLAPDAETPVRGAATTLRWQPVDGARAYRVQVAADADFSTLVVDSRLGAVTSLHVRGLMPGDDGRVYWRVAPRGGAFTSSSFALAKGPRPTSAVDERGSRTVLAVGVVLSLVAAVAAFVLMPTHTETAARQAMADSLATAAAADSTAAPAAAAPASADSTAAAAAPASRRQHGQLIRTPLA